MTATHRTRFAIPKQMTIIIFDCGAHTSTVVEPRVGAAMSFASRQRCSRHRRKHAKVTASTMHPPQMSVRRSPTFIMRPTRAKLVEMFWVACACVVQMMLLEVGNIRALKMAECAREVSKPRGMRVYARIKRTLTSMNRWRETET